MKDYDRYILWLDYFDSSMPRNKGRRVPSNSAVRSPTLQELKLAAERLGLKPEAFEARRPSSLKRTGYIQVQKLAKKQQLIRKLSLELARVRSETRQGKK